MKPVPRSWVLLLVTAIASPAVADDDEVRARAGYQRGLAH